MVEGRVQVLAVDDDALFLALLREVVRGTRHLAVAGEARSGERAVAMASRLRPDLVLMDVTMPGIGGIAAAEAILAERPETVMVLISAIHPDEMPALASTGRAHAVVWKSVLDPGLLDELWLEHGARISR